MCAQICKQEEGWWEGTRMSSKAQVSILVVYIATCEEIIELWMSVAYI